MNLRQVEIFCAVMRSRTTIAAAYELNISQPGISNAIKHLEAQAGIQLFDRVGNRLIPTWEAIALYRDAEPLHAMSKTIARKMTDMRDTKRGHLRILTTNALMRSVASEALAGFLQDRDDVQVFFDVRRMEGIVESIESGFADFGLAMAPSPRPGIIIEHIATMEMVAVLPRGHPMASLDVITPTDLDGQRLIGLESISRIGTLLRQHFEEQGIAYRPHIEVRHSTTACSLVERGLGVSVVDRFSASPQHNWNLEMRRFAPPISTPACVMYLKERPLSPLAERFIQTMHSKIPGLVA